MKPNRGLAGSIARLFEELERGEARSAAKPAAAVETAEVVDAGAPLAPGSTDPSETAELAYGATGAPWNAASGSESVTEIPGTDWLEPAGSEVQRVSAGGALVVLEEGSSAPGVIADADRPTDKPPVAQSAATPVELLPDDEAPLTVPDPLNVPSWAVREVDQRSSLDTAAATLEQAVRNYLWGPDPAPRELAHRIEELSQRLTGAGELPPVLAAVERLALGTEGPDSTALQLARRILSPQVALALATLLGSSVRDGPRRERLSAAIVRLGPPMVPAITRLLTESTERAARRAYIDVMSAFGEAALPALRELAGDSRWFVVRNAILLLREHGEGEVEYISAALQHEDPRVRKEALLALAHMGVESAAPLVASKLTDPDSDVRKSAAVAAGAVRSSRVVKPLLDRLDREAETEVVESILLALGQIGDASAVPAIEKRSSGRFFTKPHSSVRVAAYRALAAIGTPHARKRVSDAANDRDPVVREAVDRLMRGG